MSLTIQAEYDVLKERHAERWALDACRSATFSGCLKAFGVAPSMTVSTAKGKTLTINASGIYAARRRFLAGLELDLGAPALTSAGDKLAEMFLDWLLHEYSDRYRSMASEDQRVWLRQVVILVIARHLMEQKYTRSLRKGGDR